jgi:hypothetical protein
MLATLPLLPPMKTSCQASPKPLQPKAVLLIGPPGARKTTLAMQFPGLYILDIDRNLDGPERHVRKLNPTLAYSYDVITLDSSDAVLDPWDVYQRCITLLKGAAEIPTVSWVLLDGLTGINEYIIQKVMREQRITYLEARNWSTFKSDAINLLFTKLRQCNKNVIVTAHEVENTKANDKDMFHPILMGYEPFIQSGVREMLGGFFTDVWRLETNPGVAGKVESVLTTDKVPLMKQLKNSVGLPHTIPNPTYEILHKLSGGLI